MSHVVRPSDLKAASDEDASSKKPDGREADKSKDESSDKEKDEDRKHSKADEASKDSSDEKDRKDEDRKKSEIPKKDSKHSTVSEKGEDRKKSEIPEKDSKHSTVSEKGEDRKKSEVEETKKHDEKDDKHKSEDWKSHEPTGVEEKPDKKEKHKSRADTYTFKAGKSVSCGDAKRFKIEIEQLSHEVNETFAASLFAIKKSYSDRDAMKQLKKMAKELSELLNEIAKSFISKLHKIEKERARVSLTAAAELFLKQGERMRTEFEDPEEYAEEIQLCIDTSMSEIKRVEKSLRSSSDESANLLKRAMIVALEEMIEIASTPFEKKKEL